MLSFSAEGFAIRICTNCCVLSRLPWAWARSAPTGWLIRFALPHSAFVFNGTVLVLRLLTSVLIPFGATEWPSTTCIQNMHQSSTNQLAGNHGKCRKQCHKSGSYRRHQMPCLRYFLNTVSERRVGVKREHCVLCFHFGYC